MAKAKKSTKPVVKESAPKAVSPRAKEAKTAISQMNTELRQVYDKFTVKLSTINKNEILARYDLGKAVAAVVTDSRKYGENAAKLLSAALNMSESLLYNLRNLYTQWKDNYEELKTLTDAKNAAGIPLSYSHMVVINTLSTQTERNSIAQRCLRECLSVEDLKALVQEKYGNRSNNRGTISPRNPGAGVAVMTKALDKLSESHNKIQTAVFDRIEDKPEDFANSNTVEKLLELKGQLSLSRHTLSEDEARIEALVNKLSELMEDPDTETTEDAEIAEAVGMTRKSKVVAEVEDEDEDVDAEEDVEDTDDDDEGDSDDDSDDDDFDDEDDDDAEDDAEDDEEDDEEDEEEEMVETAPPPKAQKPEVATKPSGAPVSAGDGALDRIRQMQQMRAAAKDKPKIGLASV